MALVLGNAYSISNLSFQDGNELVNLNMSFSKCFYYKSKDEQYTNVKRMTYAFDEQEVEFFIFLLDENNNVIDKIRLGVNYQVRNAYYISFVLESSTILDDSHFIGLSSITLFTGNDSLFLGEQHYVVEYNGSTYPELYALPEDVSDIEIVADDGYSVFKRPIEVFFYPTLPVGWDDSSIDISKTVVNGTIVRIGDLPFERHEDTTPPGNIESFTIICEPYDLNIPVHFLLGEPGSIEYGLISTVDGEAEKQYDIEYTSSKTVTYALTGYYFTQASIDAIKSYLENYLTDNGNVPLPCTSIDYELNEDGEIEITFNELFNDVDNEMFGIYTDDSQWAGASLRVGEVFAKPNPKVTMNLTGYSSTIHTDDVVDFNASLDIPLTLLSGYTHEERELIVVQDGVDITNQCVITDTNIHIEHVRGDLVVTVKASESWTLNIKQENTTLATFNVLSRIKNISFRKLAISSTYDLSISGQTTAQMTITVPQGKKVVGIGVSGTVLIILNRGTVQSLDLTNYGSGKVTNLQIMLEDEQEIPTSFRMSLYQMNCEKNTVDKTPYLVFVETLSGTLRESCSIVSPIITFESSVVPSFNYVYLPSFNRYYFVNEITNIKNGLWQVSLRCDVLTSFKDIIRSQTCIVARNEYDYNKLIKDEQRLVEDSNVFEVKTINDYGFFEKDGYVSDENYVVQVVPLG